MILEKLLDTILSSFGLASFTIPQLYVDSLSQLLDFLGSLEFFLPINETFSCVSFVITFAIVCGFIKIVIHK